MKKSSLLFVLCLIYMLNSITSTSKNYLNKKNKNCLSKNDFLRFVHNFDSNQNKKTVFIGYSKEYSKFASYLENLFNNEGYKYSDFCLDNANTIIIYYLDQTYEISSDNHLIETLSSNCKLLIYIYLNSRFLS